LKNITRVVGAGAADYVRRVYGRLTCEKEFLYLADAPHLVMTDYVDDVIPPVSTWLEQMMER